MKDKVAYFEDTSQGTRLVTEREKSYWACIKCNSFCGWFEHPVTVTVTHPKRFCRTCDEPTEQVTTV